MNVITKVTVVIKFSTFIFFHHSLLIILPTLPCNPTDPPLPCFFRGGAYCCKVTATMLSKLLSLLLLLLIHLFSFLCCCCLFVFVCSVYSSSILLHVTILLTTDVWHHRPPLLRHTIRPYLEERTIFGHLNANREVKYDECNRPSSYYNPHNHP